MDTKIVRVREIDIIIEYHEYGAKFKKKTHTHVYLHHYHYDSYCYNNNYYYYYKTIAKH